MWRQGETQVLGKVRPGWGFKVVMKLGLTHRNKWSIHKDTVPNLNVSVCISVCMSVNGTPQCKMLCAGKFVFVTHSIHLSL